MADPVWLLVMFDLPVRTKAQRKRATDYRKRLLESGFSAIQLSVYAKYVLNASGLRTIVSPLKRAVPAGGEVRLLRLTDTQWGEMYRWFGAQELEPEARPSQLLLFGLDDTDESQAFSGRLKCQSVDSAER